MFCWTKNTPKPIFFEKRKIIIQNAKTQKCLDIHLQKEKSRIQETKHLPTDADSSTDAIGGWTKNTPKPNLKKKKKKIKNAITQKRLE
jgi:hypothetical protein